MLKRGLGIMDVMGFMTMPGSVLLTDAGESDPQTEQRLHREWVAQQQQEVRLSELERSFTPPHNVMFVGGGPGGVCVVETAPKETPPPTTGS